MFRIMPPAAAGFASCVAVAASAGAEFGPGCAADFLRNLPEVGWSGTFSSELTTDVALLLGVVTPVTVLG